MLVMLSALRGVVMELDYLVTATHDVFLQFAFLSTGVLQRVASVLLVAMVSIKGPICIACYKKQLGDLMKVSEYKGGVLSRML